MEAPRATGLPDIPGPVFALDGDLGGAKGTNRTDLTKNTLSRSGRPCQRAPELPPEAPGKL